MGTRSGDGDAGVSTKRTGTQETRWCRLLAHVSGGSGRTDDYRCSIGVTVVLAQTKDSLHSVVALHLFVLPRYYGRAYLYSWVFRGISKKIANIFKLYDIAINPLFTLYKVQSKY
jgi:hypothetical protein